MAYTLQSTLKPGFHPNATHATHTTQSIALRALRKRKRQVFDWLLRLLAVSIDHSYWRALACVAFEWKPVLRNVFCLRNFIAFIAFLAHFSYAIDCVACVAFGWKPGFRLWLSDDNRLKSKIIFSCSIWTIFIFERAAWLDTFTTG